MIFLRQNHYGKTNQHVSHQRSSHPSSVRRHQELNAAMLMQPNNSGDDMMIPRTARRSNRVTPNAAAAAATANNSNSLRRQNSVVINERLASIGGLFGALSIIITGALLYGIFTAKSSEKWYYIVAVLVNIGLLVFLMLAAILFDRVYLKKRRVAQSNRTATAQQLLTMAAACRSSSNQHHRVVHATPRQVSAISAAAAARESLLNDVPPKYPGHLIVDEIKGTSNNNSNNNNQQQQAASAAAAAAATTTTTTIPSVSRHVDAIAPYRFQIHSTLSTSSTAMPPPDYYDLYPNFVNRNSSRPDQV